MWGILISFPLHWHLYKQFLRVGSLAAGVVYGSVWAVYYNVRCRGKIVGRESGEGSSSESGGGEGGGMSRRMLPSQNPPFVPFNTG